MKELRKKLGKNGGFMINEIVQKILDRGMPELYKEEWHKRTGGFIKRTAQEYQVAARAQMEQVLTEVVGKLVNREAIEDILFDLVRIEKGSPASTLISLALTDRNIKILGGEE
jgi:hypothetical protein